MRNKKSIGLPSGPNEFLKDITQHISVEGYKRYSEDVNNPYNIIESSNITMEDVDFPVRGYGNNGIVQDMIPGENYNYGNADYVVEMPMAQTGGNIPLKTVNEFGQLERLTYPSSLFKTEEGKSQQAVMLDPVVVTAKGPITLAKEQMKEYGITDELAKGYVKGKSEKAYNNITPQGYGNITKNLDRVRRFKGNLGRDKDALWYDGPENGNRRKYTIPNREDAFKLYLGMPQVNNSFSVSDYKPGDSEDKSMVYLKPTYFKNPEIRQELLDNYFRKYDGGIFDGKRGIGNERSLSRGEYKGDGKAWPSADNSLGDFTFDMGEDEKGSYISIYDIWDLNPFNTTGEGSSINRTGKALLNLFNKKSGKKATSQSEVSEIFGAGKPFEIYERIYFDPKTKKILDKKQEGGSVLPQDNNFLNNLEKLINASIGDINKKAKDFAENPEELNNTDNMRHAVGGRYAAETIQQKVRDLPYVGGLLDFVGVDKAAGFIGANALGLGHELSTIFGGDERPFLAKLQEMGEDTFNNYVGSIVGSLDIDDYKKDDVIRYLSYNNLLPDGFVRTEKGKKDGLSEDIYFKDGEGKRKTPEYKRGGGLLNKTMKCNSCGWSWKAADGGADVSTCHKCGGSALPKAQDGLNLRSGIKNNPYNKPIEKEEGIVASIDNFITPIIRSFTNSEAGTRKDIDLRIPPGEMKYFRNNEKPVNSNYIIGGDYMEDTPTAYKASEYPNTMFTTRGQTQEIDFETQQFYGVVDGNIKLGKKTDFKDDDVIVALRPNFGGNFSIKERESLDPEFIEKARKFNEVTNEIRESAYFYPEQKVWEEMNNMTFAKKYIPGVAKTYNFDPEYKDIIDQVNKTFGKGSYMYDLEPMLNGYNSNGYDILNPAGNELDTFGNKVILFDPESNEHLFISHLNKQKRNEKIIAFKKKYPNANYLNLDNGRFTNYMVNKDGITSDDATEYMQNSFKGPDATGYNFAYQEGGNVPKAQDGRGQATLTSYEEPEWYEKALDRLASPMTTFGYTARNQDIPDNLPINMEERNAFDSVIDTLNPFAWIKYGAQANRDLDEGNYLDAGLSALGAIPIVPAWLAKSKKVLPPAAINKISGYTDDVIKGSDDMVEVFTSNGSKKLMKKTDAVRLNRIEDANVNKNTFTNYEDGNWFSDAVRPFYLNNAKNTLKGGILKPGDPKRVISAYLDPADAKLFDITQQGTERALNMSGGIGRLPVKGEYVLPPGLVKIMREGVSGPGYNSMIGNSESIMKNLDAFYKKLGGGISMAEDSSSLPQAQLGGLAKFLKPVIKKGIKYADEFIDDAISNAYKYNPNAFQNINSKLPEFLQLNKAENKNWLRQVGRSAIDDVKKTGIVREMDEVLDKNLFNEKLKALMNQQTGIHFSLDKRYPGPFFKRGELFFDYNKKARPNSATKRNTRGKSGSADYLIETDFGAKKADWFFQPGYMQKMNIDPNPFSKMEGDIGIMKPWRRESDNFNFYKKDWWDGYKKIPLDKLQPGGETAENEDKIKKTYNAFQDLDSISTARRNELQDALNIVVSSQGDDPNLSGILLMSGAMENSWGAHPGAYGRDYTRGPMSIDDIAYKDLFEPRGENNRYTSSQQRNFKWLESLGYDYTKMDSILRSDDALAAIAAARMQYGRVPEALPSVSDPNAMYQYYMKHYNKTNSDHKDRFMKFYNELIKKETGGEIEKYAMYKDYIKGLYKGNKMESKAEKNYDKLNRVHYRDAKSNQMSPANYILTHVIG